MTTCPNCQSENGTKKANIWKCKVCNGEHKISLNTDKPEEAHATTASTSSTTGHGQVHSKPESETREHEAPERATTGNSSADSK